MDILTGVTNAINIQYDHAKTTGWLPFFFSEAKKYGFPAEVPIAIASRETELNPLYLKQKGDPVIRGGHVERDEAGAVVGHGHGLMQIDDRSFGDWCIAKNEEGVLLWHVPQECIAKGCEVLAAKRTEVVKAMVNRRVVHKGRAYPLEPMSESTVLQIAIASYNCGAVTALYTYTRFHSPDISTTHNNYSADVLARAVQFKKLIERDYGTEA